MLRRSGTHHSRDERKTFCQLPLFHYGLHQKIAIQISCINAKAPGFRRLTSVYKNVTFQLFPCRSGEKGSPGGA